MAQGPNIPSHPGPKRRSQRVLMQVPVRLRGANAQGTSFEEETETLAISAHGALVLLQTRLTSGTKIQLQHKKTLEEQECHVVFLGPVRGNKAEIGLEFSAPRPQFWRVAFPPEDWSPKSPESRTASTPRSHQK
ncbi:MAG TPA: PilZ domain-containing protein [Candidatus Acidoferrum sp.]|nr:PilZ domain-containing protein [Candidatus Acidoferrum sp.]